MAGMTAPDCQAETGPLLHSGSKEEYAQNMGDPTCLLALPCPAIKSMENHHNSNQAGLLITQTLQ